MGVTGLFGAVASDRLGPKLSLVVGLLATAAAACVFLVASEWMLILLAVLHGGGHGLVTIGGETYLVRAARARQVGAASAAYFLGNTMGSAVGAAAGGAILEATSFATLGRLMLGASLAMTAAALIWLPRIAPRAGRARGSFGNADRLLEHVAPRLHETFYRNRAAAQRLLGDRRSGHAIRRRDSHRLQRHSGVLCRTEPAGGNGRMLVAGPVSDRIGRKHIFTGLIASMALGAAALGLTTGNAAAFFAMGVFATGAAWALAGQIPALVKDIAVPGEAGRMMGLSLFPTAVGILIGAQLHGRLTESHTSFVFLLLAALLAIAVPAAVMLFRRSRQSNRPEPTLHRGPSGSCPPTTATVLFRRGRTDVRSDVDPIS